MTASIILGPFGLGGPEIIILFLVIFGIALLPMIFYLLNLQKAMEQVSPDLRKISPGSVWLLLIPVFGVIWNFIMVGHIADSLSAEYQRRNMPRNEDRLGYQTGMTMAILQVCGIIPFIGPIAGIVGLVFWILYWVKVNGYRTQLESNPGYFPQGVPNSQQYQQYGQQQYGQQQYGQQNQQQYPPNYGQQYPPNPSQPPHNPGQ